MREGMSKVAFEFIACQQKNHGVLILSEFIGAGQAIDGIVGSSSNWNFALSELNAANPWLSIQVAAGTRVCSVILHADGDSNQRSFFSPVEVYLGSFYGDTTSSSAYQCSPPKDYGNIPAGGATFAVSCGCRMATAATGTKPSLAASGSFAAAPKPAALVATTPVASTTLSTVLLWQSGSAGTNFTGIKLVFVRI